MAECGNENKTKSQFSIPVNSYVETNVLTESEIKISGDKRDEDKYLSPRNTRNQEETSSECSKIIISNQSLIMHASDLKHMKYFANYLSKQCKINESINIPISDAKTFSINELEMIIHCKTNKDIVSINYPFDRIPFLINALDYFSETIDSEQLYAYMMVHIPVITCDDIDNISKRSPNTMAMDKIWYQFYLAVKKYKQTKQQIHKQINDSFTKKWETLSIDVLLKMKSISYQILINTLKLCKVTDQASNINDPLRRNCIVTFEFLSKRPVTDLYKLWNSIAKSRNYRYLLNILSTMTKQYWSRINLRWTNISENGQICENKYQRFIGKPDIGLINDEFIIHTLSILVADESIHFQLYNELCDIIKIYRKSIAICAKPEMNTFYTKMVSTFFKQRNDFHPSMIMLFNKEYYNARTLNVKFQSLNQEIKRRFVWNCLEQVEYISEYKNVHHFLITYNKHEVLKCLFYQMNELRNKPNHYTKTIVTIVTSLQTFLSKSDFNKVYNNLIDKYFKIYDEHFRSFIQILFWEKYFDSTTVNEKFQNRDLDQRSKYLQDLFSSINSGKFKNMHKIIEFFLLNNTHETMKYIQTYWIIQDISTLVMCFKTILQSNNKTNVLEKLYSFTIDPYFESDYKTQYQYEAEFHIICKCFSDSEIANRFSALEYNSKTEFIKVFFKDHSGWLNKRLRQKRNYIGLLLLQNNSAAAQQTVDSWFRCLMNHYAHWITNEFLKTENISLTFLQKMCKLISDLLLTDNVETIPQEYFDFIDKHAL